MTVEIGFAAGTIWNYLDKNGETSVSKLIKETSLDSKLANRAIGWLAAERKLLLFKKGRTEFASITSGAE